MPNATLLNGCRSLVPPGNCHSLVRRGPRVILVPRMYHHGVAIDHVLRVALWLPLSATFEMEDCREGLGLARAMATVLS